MDPTYVATSHEKSLLFQINGTFDGSKKTKLMMQID